MSGDMVSIITPLYNSEAFVTETVKSVISQTYANWEMIIVDDCSTDSSYDLVEAFSKTEDRIKPVRLEENCGVAAARNTAIELAKGRYIAFLDSDDLWLPMKLERQITFMKETGALLSYTGYSKIDDDGNISGRALNVPAEVSYSELLSSNVIGCLTAVYDSWKLGKRFMPVVSHEDYALWLRILKEGNVAHGINEPLAKYRVRRASVSGNKLKAIRFQWNIYRRVEEFSLPFSMYLFLRYAYCGYRKYIT